MSVPNRPLSYCSLEAVLEHMTPNQRLKLIRKCPSIKITDRNVPQKIDEFQLQTNSITINGINYQLGIIQYYGEGVYVPVKARRINESGGAEQDMDKYGFEIAMKLTPGEDVHVTPDYRFATERPGDPILDKYVYQDRLDFELLSLEGMKQKIEKERGNQRWNEMNLQFYINQVLEHEAAIIYYQSILNDNQPPPFTFYLQLTISRIDADGREVQAKEFLEYDRSYSLAMKYLIGRLLNKTTNHANTFRITARALDTRDFYFWLPAELNLTAQHLRIDKNCKNILRAFENILTRVNRRFKSVAVKLDRRINYHTGIVGSADALIIRQFPHKHKFRLNSRTFLQRRVHVEYPIGGKIWWRRMVIGYDLNLEYQHFFDLFKEWEKNGAPVGTHYSSCTSGVGAFYWYNYMNEKAFKDDQRTQITSDVFPGCMVLPMASNTQLLFYISPSGHSKRIREFTINLIVEEKKEEIPLD